MRFRSNRFQPRPAPGLIAAAMLSLGCLLALCLLLAFALLPSAATAKAKDTTATMGSLCAESGGSSATNGDLFSCCWAGWGCVRCAAEPDGTIVEGTCWVDCYTQACSDANARGRLGLPPKGKDLGTIPLQPGTLTPQTPKPPKADPAAGTVQ